MNMNSERRKLQQRTVDFHSSIRNFNRKSDLLRTRFSGNRRRIRVYEPQVKHKVNTVGHYLRIHRYGFHKIYFMNFTDDEFYEACPMVEEILDCEHKARSSLGGIINLTEIIQEHDYTFNYNLTYFFDLYDALNLYLMVA